MAHSMGVQGLRYKWARLAGEAKQITKANQRLAAKVASLNEHIQANESRIAEITAQITLLAEAARDGFGVAMQAPDPRQTIPKHHFTAWGGLQRAILDELRRANGIPRTTRQLADAIDASHGMRLTCDQMTQLSTSIRYRMRHLRAKDLVARVESQHGIGNASSWVLKVFVE
ncbi:hypothetical protein [Noviherbaspirillum massiliense]|uniref:hypothetical protein n=1 Tax=Noviherbaspirillum massiliense TaxID=1465823 RepID=UPI0011DE20C3|nr:hypothetical protein [Noviherbaspirillum massiliense]